MSTAAITTIALSMPVLASNAVFSYRRASRGIDAMDENPALAAANMNIAAAQVLKGSRAAKDIASAVDPAISTTVNAADTIKKISDSNKILKGVGKVIDFTADNINPVIIATSAVKVAGSDDKLDTTAREATRLTCMFGAEALAKELIGMPIAKKINGKTIMCNRKSFLEKNGIDNIEKLFSPKQLEVINQTVDIKSIVNKMPEGLRKSMPSAIKGLLFVLASIGGYKLGDAIATEVLGKEKTKKD